MTLTLSTPYEYNVGTIHEISIDRHTKLIFTVESVVVKGQYRWDTKQYQVKLTGIKETLDIDDCE